MTTTLSRPRHLTEAEAIAGYRAVCAAIADTYRIPVTPADHPVRQGDGDPAWYTAPVLVEDFSMWHSETRWAVVWEGSGADWPLDLHGRLTLPAGVDWDAFASFALSLFPKED